MSPSARFRRAADMLVSLRSAAILGRVTTLLIAYVSTALGVVATIYLVRRHTDAPTLAATMSALFMIQLTAGLEPATVRGLLLRKERPACISVRLVVPTAAAKAMLASPAIFAIWWFTWADVPSLVALAAIVPCLTAIGFVTSELRSLYEARGHYARGIWAKQGSVLIGILLIAIVCLAGGSVMLAITLSQAGRLLFLLPFLFDLKKRSTSTTAGDRTILALLWQSQWKPLAGISILSAVSGSLDRLVVLRFLSPADSATYIVMFEFLSKYWLLSYILAPIMFARRASDAGADVFRRQAGYVLAAGGVAFLAGTLLAAAFLPAAIAAIFGAAVPRDILLMLAFSVAVNALCQLLTADLQGKGRAHGVIVLQGALLAGSIPLFFGLGMTLGLKGIAIAWLVRTTGECALLRWMDGRTDVPSPLA